MHILLGLWNAKKSVLEKEAEEQKKAEGKQSGGQAQGAPSISSIMAQAKQGMPNVGGSAKVPSMPKR